MFKVEVIGNIGADAMIKGEAGKQFISFNVAHTDRWTDGGNVTHEQTQWVQCIINDTASKVLPYLVKGKSVFVRGDARLRVFSSEKERRMVAGITVNVREIELIGGQVDTVPRRLNDSQGVIYEVWKAFYLDPALSSKPHELFDSQMHKYAVDENGFITRLGDSYSQGSQPAGSGEYHGQDAKTFD